METSPKEEETAVYILCLKVSDTSNVHPDSVKSKCVLCKVDIWVMQHNLELNTICRDCVPEISKAHGEEPEFGIRPIDLKKAIEFIGKDIKNRRTKNG